MQLNFSYTSQASSKLNLVQNSFYKEIYQLFYLLCFIYFLKIKCAIRFIYRKSEKCFEELSSIFIASSGPLFVKNELTLFAIMFFYFNNILLQKGLDSRFEAY